MVVLSEVFVRDSGRTRSRRACPELAEGSLYPLGPRME